MKVIQRGYEREVTCPKCKAKLVYENIDIREGFDTESDYICFVVCPDCEHRVTIR